MGVSILGPTAFVLLALSPAMHAQYLNLPQYDNGANLAYFVQADLNNDGKADIVGIKTNAPTTVGSDIVALLGNGTGGFGVPVTTAITRIDNAALGQFFIGDFNGDGSPDVAIFGTDHVTGQHAVGILLGNGDGTFQAAKETILSVPGTPLTGICAAADADFNGDGRLDLTYLSNNGGALSLVFLAGKADGTFAAGVATSVSVNTLGCLASGDFNNDGKIDLAGAGSGGGGSIYMMPGKGNGTFQAPITVGKGGQKIVAAQLGPDSNLDLVAERFDSPVGITVLLGDGTGHFPTTHTYYDSIAAGASNMPAVVDLNGDGRLDIAWIGAANHAEFVSVLLNNGDGSFALGKSYDADGLSPTVGFLAADLNGDRKTDFAFGNFASGISVILGNGPGTFKANLATLAGGRTLRAAQLNKDNKPDSLVWNGNGSTAWLGNGDGTFNVSASSSCDVNGAAAFGDFNRDGSIDIAGPGNLNGLPVISVCLNNGAGTLTTSGHYDQGVQHNLVLAGDFNNDGKLDLVASDQSGFSVLLGNGDGSFQNGIPASVNATQASFFVRDFNNDGNQDLAVLTSSGVEVFLGNGNGTFKAPILTSEPTSSGFITAADLNADGKKDVVVAGGVNLTVLLGNGNGTFQAPVTYALHGSALTQPVFGDFNRDGSVDVAVAVTTATDHVNVVDVFFGDGKGKFSATPTVFRVGGPISALDTADFNLDGKPDLAVQSDFEITLLHQ